MLIFNELNDFLLKRNEKVDPCIQMVSSKIQRSWPPMRTSAKLPRPFGNDASFLTSQVLILTFLFPFSMLKTSLINLEC